MTSQFRSSTSEVINMSRSLDEVQPPNAAEPCTKTPEAAEPSVSSKNAATRAAWAHQLEISHDHDRSQRSGNRRPVSCLNFAAGRTRR